VKKLSFVQNTILLVISNLITGSLNFLFSIILSREIGANGVGLYQIVMPLYTLFICFTSGGVVTAISKIVAEHNSRHNMKQLYKTISTSITFFSFWTILVSIFLVIFSPFISTHMLKDTRVYLSILVFVPALLFIAISSILKGYFYGMQNTAFPAIIDIVEKSIRITMLLTLTVTLKDCELNIRVAGAVSAMTAGEFISLVLLYIFYKKSYFDVKLPKQNKDNGLQIIADVLVTSLPLCINGFLATILGTFIAIMIPQRLQCAGFSPETSLALYGKVSGMALTIIMFPSVIITSLSTILVPIISEESAKYSINNKGKYNINKKIYASLKVTVLVASVSAAIFFSLSDELGMLFYNRNDLGGIVFSLSFGVLFVYIESTLFGILNGLGKQKILLRNTLIMSSIDVILLYILLGNPKINIYGFAIDFCLSHIMGSIVSAIEVKKSTGVKIDLNELFLLPLSASFIEILIINSVKIPLYKALQNINLTTTALLFIGTIAFSVFYVLFKKIFRIASC
jgi:stage V sporulation protein B